MTFNSKYHRALSILCICFVILVALCLWIFFPKISDAGTIIVNRNYTLDQKILPAPLNMQITQGRLPNCFMMLHINNKVLSYYVAKTQMAEKRSATFLRGLRKVMNKYPDTIPDGYYFINVGDCTPNNTVTPILAVTASDKLISQGNVILIPDTVALSGYSKIFNAIDHANVKSWSERGEKIFWRGASTGGGKRTTNIQQVPRLRLLEFVNDLEYVDVGITKYSDCLTPEFIRKVSALYPLKKYVKIEDSLKFKYMFDVDGHSCSFARMAWLLYSNSLIFKIESDQRQWYYSRLKSGINYLDVNADFSNLDHLYKWAEKNPCDAERIAQNARRLAEEVFCDEAIELAIINGFIEYQNLLKKTI